MTLLGRNKTMTKGEITAFLSLVLLLILALVGTTIEAARVNTARGFSERTLEMAMDSVFTQYGRNLFEEYHVFFLEQGIGNETELVDQLKEYMSFTLEPNKELRIPGTDKALPNVNLWGISTSNIEVKKQIYATDYQGELFRNQAVEYMKYRTSTMQIEKVLGYLECMNQTTKTSDVVEKKLEVEESLGELNKDMVQCIELVEGISFRKSGIQYTTNNLLKTEENFVKQFCPLPISSSNLGINNTIVWNSLKTKYVNPIDVLESMKEIVNNIKQIRLDLNTLQEQMRQCRDSMEAAKSKKEKASYGEAIQNLQTTYDALVKEMEGNITNVKEKQSNLMAVSSAIQPKIEQVLQLLPQMEQKQQNIRLELEEYKTLLLSNKEEILPDVYEGLKEEQEDMEQYAGKEAGKDANSFIYCMQQMQPVLETNRSVLEGCSGLGKISVYESESDWDGLLGEIKVQTDAFKQYQVKPLTFDYSSLKIQKQVPNPVTSLNNVLGEGMLNLVIADQSNLSKNKIENPDNLYQLHKSQDIEEKEQADVDMEKAMAQSEEEGYSSEITGSFGAYGKNASLQKTLGEQGSKLGEAFLWSEYLDSHFTDYLDGLEKEDGKQSALSYEKEYILAGKATDQENLQNVVARLVSLRCILNFLSILGDSQKREMAYATAAALVGYTCMEPLVRLTQMLILVVWALEEALVDTAALLAGKTIPIIKDKTSFLLRYEELFLINKVFIQKKVAQLPEKGSGKINIGYQDYIKLFLWMEKQERQNYRAMDLVQENIKLRYRKDFDISQCLYGVQIKAEWQVPSKFINLWFVKRLLNKQKEGWSIQAVKDYSY